MTIKDFYNEIVAEKESMSSLASLAPDNDNAANLLASVNSKSAVAIWRLWAWLHAAAHYFQYARFLIFKAEAQELVDRERSPSVAWYLTKAGEYQHGDVYQLIDGVAGYAVIDPAKQIIKRKALVKNGGVAYLKVAGEDGGGNAIQLTSAQRIGFLSYMDEFTPPGSSVELVSLGSDLLKLALTVNYKGIYLPDVVKAAVIDAINLYLKTLDFEKGELKENDLIRAIRSVAGVDDVYVTIIEAKRNAGVYVDAKNSYLTASGYINIDTDFPLADNIVMVPII